MENRIFYLHALSSLHVGSGEAGGIIDLPIAREKASNLPVAPGSSIKGVLRYELDKCEGHTTLFGPDTNSENTHAGALSIGDAHLLALPIRSYQGTFCWATCPMILFRYSRDLSHRNRNDVPDVMQWKNMEEARVTNNSDLTLNRKIYLEDIDLTKNAEEDVLKNADAWASFIAADLFDSQEEMIKIFKSKFIILHDNVFSFLSETATEIRARIKIKEGTRSVEKGGLWYEENLPAESLLWGIIATDRARDNSKKTSTELINLIPEKLRLQIGGNASVGNGQIQWVVEGLGNVS